MKLGGVVTALFILAGVVLFGLGLYTMSVKDEDVIDDVIRELKTLRLDMEKERKVGEQFRTDILLTANKIDDFINQDHRDTGHPALPQIPSKIDVMSRDRVSLSFDQPIKVEIIERKSHGPPPLPKSVVKKSGGKDARKK